MEPAQKLKALPVQFVEMPDGVILVRGGREFKIAGQGAVQVAKGVLTAAFEKGITKEEILELFSGPDRPAVGNLVDQLVSRRILVPEGMPGSGPKGEEGPLDIFYWNFGVKTESAQEALNDKRIVIIGVNHISRRMVDSFAASGVTNVEVVDFNLLKNLSFFDENENLRENRWGKSLPVPVPYKGWTADLDPKEIDCLIAVSDFGGRHLMRDWNKFCVQHRILFLPVVLDKMVGFVGPLVSPGDTACYECLRIRENSNLDNPEVARASEYHAFQGQKITGFHPAMASALGDFAVMELTKFFTMAMPFNIGTLIEVNLLFPELKSRKVLKMPRCTVCGPLVTRAPASPLKEVFLPYKDLKLAE